MENKNFYPFTINAATIYIYKSSRKNAKIIKSVNINHLITQAENRQVKTDRIVYQFVSVLESILCAIDYNWPVNITCYSEVGKETEAGWETLQFNWNRVQCENISELERFLYNIFCLIYPYNKISYQQDLMCNRSVQYYIDKCNKMEV